MDNLEIKATRRTPDIFFDCGNNLLEIRGKSYPSDISEYYAPVFSWIERYLGQLNDQHCTVKVNLVYFNSSTSKVLMDFFSLLEESVRKGRNISVNWIYDEEDEDNMEYGEEFKEDLEVLTFNLVKKEEN
ncbi:DUF1987 domain-containing protein [Desulfococcaceae bacterium HSG8]|nr:DUF1987 domain-containing protein [Desulfococcaceae bacterium HSG8]